MGEKSRYNYSIPVCMKYDCVNRMIRCHECVTLFQYYEPFKGGEDGQSKECNTGTDDPVEVGS